MKSNRLINGTFDIPSSGRTTILGSDGHDVCLGVVNGTALALESKTVPPAKNVDVKMEINNIKFAQFLEFIISENPGIRETGIYSTELPEKRTTFEDSLGYMINVLFVIIKRGDTKKDVSDGCAETLWLSMMEKLGWINPYDNDDAKLIDLLTPKGRQYLDKYNELIQTGYWTAFSVS